MTKREADLDNIAVMEEHRVATETLAFAALIELKAEHDDDEERGVFEGLASTFGNVDRGGDVIMPGAFAAAVKGSPKKIKLLFAHDTREPVGVIMELEETDRGLRIKGRLLIEQGVPTADKVFALMKAGALDALSIGFMVPNNGATFDREAGVRVIKKIELMEISIVTFAMNPKAKIQRVKAVGNIETKRDFEDYLRDAGFSANAAKAITAGGFKEKTSDLRDGAGDEVGDLVEARIARCQEIRASVSR